MKNERRAVSVCASLRENGERKGREGRGMHLSVRRGSKGEEWDGKGKEG
jgi:hypothetical protein